MIDSPTADDWARLRAIRPKSASLFASLPVEFNSRESAISIAIDEAGDLHLVVPVAAQDEGIQVPDLNGLRVRRKKIDGTNVLDVFAPSSHEQVFTPFCREIVKAILEQRRDPWKAVAATIRAWQLTWKPIRQQMDKARQIGAFGELLVLRNLMIPCLGPGAVEQWSGPLYERHDFVGENLRIEVKTTKRSRFEHEISRLDQLRCPAGSELLVVSIQLEESIGGSETLASEVDKIANILRGHSASLDDFLTKMAEIGWRDELRVSGELLKFNIRSSAIFVVDSSFPRLPDDFDPPTGVVSVKYTIDLANIPSIGVEEAKELVKKGNPNWRSQLASI